MKGNRKWIIYIQRHLSEVYWCWIYLILKGLKWCSRMSVFLSWKIRDYTAEGFPLLVTIKVTLKGTLWLPYNDLLTDAFFQSDIMVFVGFLTGFDQTDSWRNQFNRFLCFCFFFKFLSSPAQASTPSCTSWRRPSWTPAAGWRTPSPASCPPWRRPAPPPGQGSNRTNMSHQLFGVLSNHQQIWKYSTVLFVCTEED